jgi:predicted HAD superfamily Cof-like phosphohydrolase
MLKTQKAVHEMMKALDLPLPNEVRPGLKGLKYDLLRSLVSEEAAEFENAMSMLQIIAERDDAWHMSVLAEFHKVLGEGGFRQFCEMDKDEFVREVTLYWWAEAIDAMCDIIVVVHNTANAMGLDLEPFFDEVHRTNMQKAEGPLREDGKRLKPPRILEMLKRVINA